MEAAVTTPLEQQINGAEGMKYITSTSGNDGVSQITATFDLTRDPDLASVDIQNRVNTASGPPSQRRQTSRRHGAEKLRRTSSSAPPFFPPDNRYSTLFMSNYLDVYVRDNLKRVPGVADVLIFGERKYSMRLWLDPVRMAGRALTADDVVNALQEQNVEVAAGQVGSQPSVPGQQFQISVRAIGRLSEAAQFDNIILKSNADGTLVRLKRRGPRRTRRRRLRLRPRVQRAASRWASASPQLSTANALDVDRRCVAELERLAKRFPPGMKYEIAFDTTDAVSESIRDVLFTVGSAILLVILVIFIFLGDWRTTIIHFIATPVSLIGTFTFVKLLGFSINTLTLFGITLATGLVVDDAIVVIENIERHLQEGEPSAAKAASDAMREVTGAVIATSLVLVAVFVPVAFFPGTTGILFRQFALTIAFSIAISAFNALTLAPALAAMLLGRLHGQKNWFSRRVDRVLAAITNGYVRALRAFLRFEAGCAHSFLRRPRPRLSSFSSACRKGFVPNEDQGYLIIAIQAPTGSFARIHAQYRPPGCRHQKELPGDQGTSRSPASASPAARPTPASSSSRLSPIRSARARSILPRRYESSARPAVRHFGRLGHSFQPPAVQGLGQFGGFQFELQDQGGHTLEELAKVTHELMRAGAGRKDLAGLFSTYTATDPQFLVTIDREKAKSLHVPLSQITDTLGVFMGSAYVNDFDFNNRSYRVYVQADKQFRAHPQDMKQYYVRSDSGAMIPLDNLLTMTRLPRRR